MKIPWENQTQIQLFVYCLNVKCFLNQSSFVSTIMKFQISVNFNEYVKAIWTLAFSLDYLN